MEYPTAFNTAERLSRKEHSCCECGCTIPNGEIYQYTSGVWCGVGASYKQCLGCHALMQAAVVQTEIYQDPPCYGELNTWLWDRYQDADEAKLELSVSGDRIDILFPATPN